MPQRDVITGPGTGYGRGFDGNLGESCFDHGQAGSWLFVDSCPEQPISQPNPSIAVKGGEEVLRYGDGGLVILVPLLHLLLLRFQFFLLLLVVLLAVFLPGLLRVLLRFGL